LATRSEVILREARLIAIDLICRMSPKRDDGVEYETACWVDGITKQTREEYCSLLQDVANVSFPIVIELANACHKANLPNPVPLSRLSTILVRALQRMPQASMEFSLLTIQVVTKCLLRDLQPLPLAVMILDAVEREDLASTRPAIDDLVEYARSIVFFDRYIGSDRFRLAVGLLKSCFCRDSYPLAWLAPGCGTGQPRRPAGQDYISLTRQVTHMAAICEGDDRVRCCNVLRRLLPVAIVVRRYILLEVLSAAVSSFCLYVRLLVGNQSLASSC
jgi:hypothetical protein